MQLDANGLQIDTFDEIVARQQANARVRFGATAKVDGSSYLGKLIALHADAESSIQEAIQAVYSSRFPHTAPDGQPLRDVGHGLLGVTAQSATRTRTIGSVTAAQAGTLPAGSIAVVTGSGARFYSTADLVFGAPGVQDVEFRAIETGDVACPAGTLVTFEDAAIAAAFTLNNASEPIEAGAESEDDMAYRSRILASPHLPGTSPEDGVRARVLAVSGVTSCRVYNNPTGNVIPANDNQPGHSVLIVVEGGDDNAVAQAIFDSISVGVESFGGATPTTGAIVKDDGTAGTLDFARPAAVTVFVKLTFTDCVGSEAAVKAAVRDWGADLVVGQDVNELDLRFAARQALDTFGDQATITAKIDTVNPPVASGTLAIGFKSKASILLGNIQVLGL